MNMKNSKKRNPPLGLTEAQYQKINIKTVKKIMNDYLIELKPDKAKDDAVVYHYKHSDGVYHILCSKKPVITPGGSAVTTKSKMLAKKTKKIQQG